MPASNDSKPPRIVVGVDGSPSSRAALRWAARQAGLTGGTVEAVIAWQIPASATGYGFAPISVETCSYLEENAKKTLEETIEDVVGPERNPSVHSVVVQAYPAQALLDLSANADLLVVGSRGHGGFAGALIGSVSQHCVHHAQCPVVVIRGEPQDDERPAGSGKKVPASQG
jgi:nucleotide-binding universal stress UspA family protein